MQEWSLKAASTKSTPSDVRGLAVSRFICCTLCKANGNPLPLVHDVQMRDVLHLYFAKKGEPFQAIGSFEVTSYKEHKQPTQFQDKWSGIPIVEVVDPKLCKLLTLSGYKRDPSLRTFAAGACAYSGARRLNTPPLDLRLADRQTFLLHFRDGAHPTPPPIRYPQPGLARPLPAGPPIGFAAK